MLNQLRFTLMLPAMIVGIIFIPLTLLFFEQLLASEISLLILTLVVTQSIVSIIANNRIVDSRLNALEDYLRIVVDTEQAPERAINDTRDDQLGRLTRQLCQFIQGLSTVLQELKKESEHVHDGAEKLSQQINQSSSAVKHSTSQIEQMATSIQDVAQTSSSLSESATQVSETTTQVIDFLNQSEKFSADSQTSIETFATEVARMANDLAILQDESARIGSVLDVIRGIADQTNLLALNAAIEAARAGEQGRGFAVVADEVRALAHRTQESTVEIQSMVEGLQEKSTNAVNAIAKGQGLTQTSLDSAAEVVNALARIRTAFHDVDQLISAMASTTAEQQQSTASINKNMVSVVDISRELNQALEKASNHADKQKIISGQVDQTLLKVCV